MAFNGLIDLSVIYKMWVLDDSKIRFFEIPVQTNSEAQI